jgi:hypothetical protein
MSEKKRTECKEVNCRKGFYTEENDGEKILCIPGRHHGEDHVRKFSLKELKELLATETVSC